MKRRTSPPYLLVMACEQLKQAIAILDSYQSLDRTALGDLRMEVTSALAKINTVERAAAGVIPPRTGE